MARLLADEQFPLPVVHNLQARGHNIVTAQDAGLSSTPDPVVLAVATAASRAVLTQDRDYIVLHKHGATHAGIVYASENLDVDVLAECIHNALASNPDLTGRLVRVYRQNKPPPPVP
jgi:predicted nuclease of predicted toxin-antitoxin system